MTNKSCVIGVIIMMSFSNIYNNSYIYDSSLTSPQDAKPFTSTHQSSYRYLGFRDMADILNVHVLKKGIALDFGVGAGYSATFLQEQGFDVIGADISKERIEQAKEACPTIPFVQTEQGILPLKSNMFDVVFSSFVLVECSRETMPLYLSEAYRTLKKDGIFIGLTVSKDWYTKKWLSIDVDFPENKNLTSGDRAKCYIADANLTFIDYYWTEDDFKIFFAQAGFDIVQTYYPLGKKEEPYAWCDELVHPPLVIFVAKKSL